MKKIIEEEKQQCNSCKHKIKGIVEINICPRCKGSDIKKIFEKIKIS